MALEFLLMSPGFNSFLLPKDEQNSMCVCVCVCGGGVGGHKMHIFTANMPIFHSRYKR
jgi:protein subunit release factor A